MAERNGLVDSFPKTLDPTMSGGEPKCKEGWFAHLLAHHKTGSIEAKDPMTRRQVAASLQQPMQEHAEITRAKTSSYVIGLGNLRRELVGSGDVVSDMAHEAQHLTLRTSPIRPMPPRYHVRKDDAVPAYTNFTSTVTNPTQQGIDSIETTLLQQRESCPQASYHWAVAQHS